MIALALLNFTIPYLQLLGAWAASMVIIGAVKIGKIAWEYVAMSFSMLIMKRRLQKDLAEKESILRKHFNMFGGEEGK